MPRRSALLVTICVTVLAAPAALAGRMQIQVRAEFASRSFNDKVNDQKKVWEQEFSKTVADRITPLIGFADWKAEPDTARPVASTLVVRLAEEGGGEMPRVVVQWLYQQGTNKAEPLPWPTVTVYERNDPNLAGSVQTLQQHTADALAKVAADSLKANLLHDFTPRIPIARQITARSAEKVFELPLRSDDLPIGPESIMDVAFSKPGPNASEGIIKLTRFGRATSGNVRGGVASVMMNSLTVPLTNEWNSDLGSMLNGSTVVCYLKQYEPARAVDNIVTVPE
jgi:hypothetical protein